MFCKWCGNSIQLTDKKCPACGRETPPMSDCGGLYDLRHSVNGPQPQAQTCPRPVVMQCPIVEKMESKYARDRKAAKKHHAMTTICFVVVLIAIVCTAVLAVNANSQLGELREQIGNIQIKAPLYPTENATNEQTENQPDDELEEPTPYSFELGMTVTNAESPTIGTAYNFDDYAKSVKVTTAVTESEKGHELAVSFILAEDASVGLDLIYGQEETEDFTIRVKCNSDLPLFDNEDFTYEWQYCTGSGDWLTVDQKLVTENNGYYGLLCDENLWNTVGVREYPRELRCIIAVENEDGDMMVITVDGFPVYQDTQFG